MPIKFQKMTLDVGLVTTDPEEAHRFYGEILGLPFEGELELPNIGLIRRYRVGENILRIFVPVSEPASRGSTEGFASQTGLRYLTLKVENLEEVVAEVAAAGYKIAVPVIDLRPGVKVSQIEDKEGNALELMQESQ